MEPDGATLPVASGVDVAALVASHHQPLYGYAYRLTGNRQDAEDLVQQTFLTAQQKAHQIRNPEAARGWRDTVLRNSYLKACRRREPDLAENLNMDLDGFAGADAAAGLTILPLVVFDIHQGLLMAQVIGIDGETGTNFFTANRHINAAQLGLWRQARRRPVK